MRQGLFGDLFDLDGDGKLNEQEKAMDFMAFNELMDEEEEDQEEDDNEDDEDEEEDEDEDEDDDEEDW